MRELGLRIDQVAAVGDSAGDAAMLAAAGLGFYVGATLPQGLTTRHRPDGDILSITREIVEPS